MENHEHKHQVRIHIDEKPYESPNPTTGEALYKLGSVQPGYDLFREVRGCKLCIFMCLTTVDMDYPLGAT
jgi:hypothetical protein